MRKLRVAFLAAVALVFAGALPADTPREFFLSTTASTTSQTVQFPFPASRITVINDGTVSIHVDGRGGTATTADPEVKTLETYAIPEPGNFYDKRTSIQVIAASATPAFRVYAYE